MQVLQIELPLPLPTKGVVFREMDWFVIKPLGKPQRVTPRSIEEGDRGVRQSVIKSPLHVFTKFL